MHAQSFSLRFLPSQMLSAQAINVVAVHNPLFSDSGKD
jgi:hypothetical protein